MSLVNQQHLLTKVYFPRLFVPIAAASVFLVDLVISLGIYAVVLLYYRVVPSWTIVFLPLLVLLTLIATLGIGIMISALTVFYRDFKHIVPFLMQIFMYVTPVIYPANVFSTSYPDGPVAQPDVRNRGGVPLGDPRPGVEFRRPWRSPRQPPWDCSCLPCSISAGPSGISPTSHDLSSAGSDSNRTSAGESITNHEPTNHHLRQAQQELSPGRQAEKTAGQDHELHCARLSAIRFAPIAGVPQRFPTR